MDEQKNRRADDRHPTTPLRWGERWTLLLTGPNAGVVGQYGATWPGQPADYERVNVYAEGTAKLDDIEQYRLQMAAIGTASFGYWKEGDGIRPDYDTVPLRDVARLYAKYEALFKAQPSDAARDVLAERRRQIEQEGYAPEHDDEHKSGEIAAYAAFFALPPDARAWPATETGYGDTFAEAIVPHDWTIPQEGDRRRELVKAGALILAEIERLDRAAAPAAPDAVEAALSDVIVHGIGAYRIGVDFGMEHVGIRHAGPKWTKDSVGKLATTIAEAVAKNAGTVPQLTFPHIFLHLCDALIERPADMEQHQADMRKVVSWPEANRAAAEIVAFSPPPMVRDALYRDYAVPAKEGGPE